MKKVLFFLSLLISISAISQNKLLTLEDALLKNRTSLAPANLKQLQFIYGTGDYVYVKKINDQDVWVRGSFKAGEETPFLTQDQLNAKLKESGMATIDFMPPIQFNTERWTTMINGRKLEINPINFSVKSLFDSSVTEQLPLEISKAGNLKNKLLLIQGLQDPVVLQQNSVDFVKACVDKGVQVDYMIYPGHEHNVQGKDRVHLYQKITDYFMEYLK